MAMPEAFYPPFFRTPEPQFSFTLLALAAYIAIKKNTFVPMYLIMPFLYPFVRVPLMFIVLTMHLIGYANKPKFFKTKLGMAGSGVLVYVALSIIIIIYQKVFLSGSVVENYLLQSRLPIFSMTGLVCLLSLPVVYKVTHERFHLFLTLVAVAPLIAVNTQVISGIIAQPKNYEQYFGTSCIALMAAFCMISIKSNLWLKILSGALAIALILIYVKFIYSYNSSPYFSTTITPLNC